MLLQNESFISIEYNYRNNVGFDRQMMQVEVGFTYAPLLPAPQDPSMYCASMDG